MLRRYSQKKELREHQTRAYSLKGALGPRHGWMIACWPRTLSLKNAKAVSLPVVTTVTGDGRFTHYKW